MCGSAYRWWGDLDADREQIAAYLEARGCGRQIPNERRNAMQIRPAQECDFAVVKKITHNTIKAIYPHYYPAGAVAFFLHHHNDERIRQDIAEGIVYLCCDAEEQPVGTVTVRQNEIARLFVLPECQGNGYGRELLNFAEAKVAEQYSEIVIDASFSAKAIYLKRGYHETAYRKIETDGGDFLCYDVMKKSVG